MLRYKKGKSPACLTGWQATPQADWESLGGRDRGEIRVALLRDQGNLCAYCERRIINDEKKMKIEHWKARSAGGEQLQWSNLLGVCLGNSKLEGKTERVSESHCDDSRGNAELYLHPIKDQGPNPEIFIRYSKKGDIYVCLEDETPTHEQLRAQKDIGKEVLNLNTERLRRGREAVYDQLHNLLKKYNFSTKSLRQAERIHTLGRSSTLPEYAGFVLYHVKRWLRKQSIKLSDFEGLADRPLQSSVKIHLTKAVGDFFGGGESATPG